MKIVKIESMTHIVEASTAIIQNLKNISESGNFIQALSANGLTNPELDSKADFFNKEIMKMVESSKVMIKFFNAVGTIAKQALEKEAQNLKNDFDSNDFHLDLRDLDECQYVKPIKSSSSSSWFSKLEID